MSNDDPERLFFHATPHIPHTLSEELRVVEVGPEPIDVDGPLITNTPTARDVALAVAAASDEWFTEFLKQLWVNDARFAQAPQFTLAGRVPHDPDFGIDPEDSARLLELRDAIDSIGWRSQADEERGDYVGRLKEIREELAQVDTLTGKCLRLATKLHRQRVELKRFNRDERLRQRQHEHDRACDRPVSIFAPSSAEMAVGSAQLTQAGAQPMPEWFKQEEPLK